MPELISYMSKVETFGGRRQFDWSSQRTANIWAKYIRTRLILTAVLICFWTSLQGCQDDTTRPISHHLSSDIKHNTMHPDARAYKLINPSNFRSGSHRALMLRYPLDHAQIPTGRDLITYQGELKPLSARDSLLQRCRQSTDLSIGKGLVDV
jgi:hypothetical protein